MAGNILLQLTPEQAAAAAEIFAGCGDLREFGCRAIGSMTSSMTGAEAQSACGAGRNERSEARENSRNGYRGRSLRTALGDVSLKVPKLRRGTYGPEGFLGRHARVEASLVALVSET
jgi:transposase-like protein